MKTRFLVSLFLACSLAGTVASAAKGPVSLAPISDAATVQQLKIGTGPSTHAACQLGVLGAPAFTFDYFFPPNDNYLTYLNTASCASCAGNPVQVTLAHITLYFPSAPCPMSVSVSVVGATGDATCREPNMADVKCPAITYTVSVPVSGLYDIQLPLPPGCCITGDAFLAFRVNTLSCNTAATRPELVLQSDCDPCVSWNIWSGGTDEFCDVVQAPNPIMFADVECCNVVPTHDRTWGGMKILYR